MEPELPPEAEHAIKRSDILAGSLALLVFGMSILLGPEWGWPCIIVGIGGLVVYFSMWRNKNPRWLNGAMIALVVLFVLSGGAVITWKSTRPTPTLARTIYTPPVPSDKDLLEEYNKALAEYRRLHPVARPSKAGAGDVSSKNGPAVGSITQTQAPCSGGIAVGGGTANGGNCGPPPDREFTDAQLNQIVAALSNTAHFSIDFESPDGEPLRYGRKIATAFSGWPIETVGLGITVFRFNLAAPGQLPPGTVLVGYGNIANARTLRHALGAAGITAAVINMGGLKEDEVALYIPRNEPF